MKITKSAILIVVLFMITSCMTSTVVAKYDSDSIQSHKATKVVLLWGLVQPRDVPAECDSNSICKVSTKTNIGYILIAAVTVGIVVPQQIVWDCCPPKVDVENL